MKDHSVTCKFKVRVDSKDNRFFKTLNKEMMYIFSCLEVIAPYGMDS